MLAVPERITSVTHPLITSVYLKKDYSHFAEDVLVIETNFDTQKNDNLNELLGDLHDLELQAREQIGHFDRIDIRTC